ncbi:MAG: hypothetical protein WCL04_06735 [Verrucomicrobiota bacterium]
MSTRHPRPFSGLAAAERIADPAPNPRVRLELAELGTGASLGDAPDLTHEERAVHFLLDVIGPGSLRTATTRVAALRWLLRRDNRPLAALARELGITRARMNQIRDALAVRLAAHGVRVSGRQHLPHKGGLNIAP